MVMMWDGVVELAKETYPRTADRLVKYGTAGFRDKENGLDYVMYRVGILAVLRSRSHNGAAVGAMITASHNPVCDNGIKLVEPAGEMLALSWEDAATSLVNVSDENLAAEIDKIVLDNNIDSKSPALIFVGRDTRASSVRLQTAVEAGVRVMGGEVKDFGVVSTPVLHFVLACHNDGGKYGTPTLEGYMEKLSQAFVSLMKSGATINPSNYTPKILYDGANGVGAQMMELMAPRLSDVLQVELHNRGEGILNFECGADFVKTTQQWPKGVPQSPNVRCASVDGDADRIVYSYIDSTGLSHLLDGDKIATLMAGYLKELIQKTGLKINLGLVQTAYANGASTEYINRKLGIPVSCSKTGVKHLHHEALNFDVGVYFEANGHGTVVFNEHCRKLVLDAAKGGNAGAVHLSSVMNLINETVGDAISDMLLVETILHVRGWSAQDWDQAYQDLPNVLMKVSVPDRSVIQTTNAERTCTNPAGLQAQIDSLVAKCPNGRSFVRPSGTEDIVRVYAEASTKQDAEALASAVSDAVRTAVSR